jgi:hypothetical protein
VADFLLLLVVPGVLVAVMVLLAWLGLRVRRRGAGGAGGVMGPFEEIWHPAAHRARLETEVVEERLAPMPSSDDVDKREATDPR